MIRCLCQCPQYRPPGLYRLRVFWFKRFAALAIFENASFLGRSIILPLQYHKLSEAVPVRPFFFEKNMAEIKETDTTRLGE